MGYLLSALFLKLMSLFDLYELVIHHADADFFGVLQGDYPVCLGGDIGEVVVVMMAVLVQKAALHGGLSVYGVGAGLVESHGIKGGEHTHIGYDSRIIGVMAVAVGRHIYYKIDVEIGSAVADCLGVLGNFAVEHIVCLVKGGFYGVHGAYAYAAAAAEALVLIYGSFSA